MIKIRFLYLLGVAIICNGTPRAAGAADEMGKQQQELSQSIQRQVLSLNVNQSEKYLINFNFSTFFGMYAYRELLLWAQAAPQQQRDDLMAMTRNGLEAVVRYSGMGIPLAGKPDGQAVGLLYNQGLPYYAAQPDFSLPATLKWNPASFERRTAPESIGQSLAAKSLYAQADTSDEGKNLRELLLKSALQEFQALLPLLELGGDKGASYMPALLKLENDKWSEANASSQIYGQMSLIQGLHRLHALLSLPALENETIADKRAADWRKEIRRALEKVYHTAIKLHFDTKAGSFVSAHERLKGPSDRLSAEDAGYILEVLADLAASLQLDDPLRTDVLAHLRKQADYVAARMEGKTSAPRIFLLKNNQVFAGMMLRLNDQLAIVNGLLAAEQITGGKTHGKIALDLFNAIRPAFWSAPSGIFRSAAGQTVSAYDGRLFGLALASWRRLDQQLAPGEARQHGDRLIERVLKQGGLQQAEGPATGEPGQPEAFIRDELPQLVSRIATLKQEDQTKEIASAIKSLSDQDGDGVPGCRFGGGRFGAAPVIIIQTSIKTPFDPPPAPAAPLPPPRSAP